MKAINLFIASSATSELLNKQKEALAKKCRELNTEFAEGNIDYYINPIAYEDLERRMEVFENHIENDDIVVFLIDGTKDPNLEEKLKVAAEKYRAGSKPELLVFVSNNIDEEYEQKIKDILKAKGWLYENLDSHDDFLTNVENRIKGYIAQYDERRKQRNNWYIAIIIFFIICGVFLFYIQNLNRQLETKRLLIVGGGSARNFIEDSLLKQKKGLSTEYWLYAPMPSGDAYRMLTEEIINSKNDYKNHPYYPVVVSAGKAPDSSAFLKKIYTPGQFLKEGVVVGIYLGNDTLIVYGPKSIIKDTSPMLPSRLDSLINNDTITIWTTSKTSGTFKAYSRDCKILEEKDNLGFFSHNDSIPMAINDSTPINNNWIVLGSKHYHPKFDIKCSDSAFVLDPSNGEYKYKKIYVYFMLYKDVDSIYKLPNATEDFLTAIGVGKIDNILSVNDSVRKNSRILYDNFELNSLKKK